MALINRRIDVSITGVNKTFSYPDLEVNFSGDFNEDPEPNIYSVEIYNLSRDSISDINEGEAIILNAGYQEDIGIISAGVITGVDVDNRNVDVITKIEFQDASNEWLNAVISRSYTGPVLASTIIEDLAQSIGLEIGNINLVNDINYQTGKTVFGKLSNTIRRIARECNTEINISSGRIDFVGRNAGFETGFILNSETGLISSPEKIDSKDSQSEYLVRMLLNHRIRPRSVLEIESLTVSGTFFVIRGTYNSDYTMEIEVARLA